MNQNYKMMWKYFQLNELFSLILERLFYQNNCYLLQINPRLINQVHSGKQRWELEPMQEDHIDELLQQADQLTFEDKKDLFVRILFYRSGFKNCYFYRLKGKIAHMQWIIYPSENNIINSKFRRQYYPLNKNEVMIENAFTFSQYRSLGLYPMATLSLLKKGREEGYGAAVSYIRIDRIGALNTFTRIGFKAKELLKEYKIAGFSWRGLKNIDSRKGG